MDIEHIMNLFKKEMEEVDLAIERSKVLKDEKRFFFLKGLKTGVKSCYDAILFHQKETGVCCKKDNKGKK